jgi:outer membrane protein OmpA-like peptidoglycan-associated protein
MFLIFTMMVITLTYSAQSQAVNLQKFHFSNSPTFATLEDGLLDDGIISTDYKYIVVGSYNYVRSPFIALDGNKRDKTIIEWMHTLNVGGAYRFSDAFQIGVSSFFTYEYLEQIGEDEQEKIFTPGDTTIDFKYKFYDKNRLAIAFTPRAFLPTGQRKNFTSNDGVGFYFGFALDKAFDYFQLAVNVGHKENPNAQYDIVDYRRQFHFSTGAIIPLFGPLDLTAEFYRDTPYDTSNDQVPSEVNVGLRFANAKDSAFFAGMGTGSLEEDSSTDARLYLGYKYFPAPKRSKKIEDEEKKFGIFYKVYNVYFDTSRSDIKDIERNKIDMMVKNLKRDPYIAKVVVEGYASRVGSIDSNEKLSTKRAKTVMDYIVKAGVDKELIHYVSFGNSKSDKVVLNKKVDRKVAFRVYRSK